MSETSISSSPSTSDYTINTTRLKRKNKRSKVDLSVQFTNNGEETNEKFFRDLLTNFYNSEDKLTTNAGLENKSKSLLENPVILKNFKAFELEKSLIMADDIFSQQLSQNNANLFSASQGFVTCESLSQANNKPQSCFINKSEKSTENDSFIITESELINCCHRAEKILKNKDSSEQDTTTLHELTPKNDNMFLVNSILKDFSQSPLSKEQLITNFSCHYTPEFRLRKRLPVKNYSRKATKCTRVNLTQRFEEPNVRHSSEYDEDMSCSSSLSVQQDDTFCENSNNPSIATSLNNTERLCENLLNLTEYFTQNELSQSFETDQLSGGDCHASRKRDIISNLPKISVLLDDILTFPSKYTNEDSYDSSDDFKGFVNNEYKIVENNEIITNLNLAPDLNASNVRRDSKTLENRKGNTFLDDWSEENCDIFACISTENVFPENNLHMPNNESNKAASADDATSKCTNKDQTFIVPNVTIVNPDIRNFSGFKTASSKPIRISKQANIMAAKILSDLTGIPDLSAQDQLPNCDNKALVKDKNIFENSEDYEWNDDCDLFLNFQTPMTFRENTIAVDNQQKLMTLPEVFQRAQDAPSTSKPLTLGFTTAAGKAVRITSKGQAIAHKLLNGFDGEIKNNKNYEEELKEMKSKIYAKIHHLTTESSALSVKKQLLEDQNPEMAKTGKFSIATEQNLNNVENEFYAESEFKHDSDSATKEIKRHEIQTEMSPNTIRENILEMKQEINKSFNLPSEISTGTQNSMEKLLKESVDMSDEIFLNDLKSIENTFNIKPRQQVNKININPCTKRIMKTDNFNISFQTANGKQVSISAEAKQIAENLLNEFSSDVDIEKDLKDIKTKVQIKNKACKPKPNHYTNNNEDPLEPLLFEQRDRRNKQLKSNINKGFQTANGKEISISDKAKQTVENLLKGFNSPLDIEGCEIDLKELKTKVLQKNKNIRSKTPNLENDDNENNKHLHEDSVNVSLTEKFDKEINDLNTNGFKTANDKQVSTSANAEQAIQSLFKDFNTFLDTETSEKYIKDMKTKIHNKNKDLPAKSSSQTLRESASTQDLIDDLPQKQINCKRKMSLDSSYIETCNKTPAVKIFKHDLQSSKSSLVEQSLKSPLTSVTRSIIVRKNLLSLTKKRKNKQNALNKAIEEEISVIKKDLDDLSDLNAETPTKSSAFMKSIEPAPETPNLKEFLCNASLTSTPCLNKPPNTSQTLKDSDLRPIVWNNEDSSVCNRSQNNSLYDTKLSESTTLNISFNSPNPTAKERIGRLKMYGKAAEVSPILIETNHNCRPSGLRRTRSMLKKLDN